MESFSIALPRVTRSTWQWHCRNRSRKYPVTSGYEFTADVSCYIYTSLYDWRVKNLTYNWCWHAVEQRLNRTSYIVEGRCTIGPRQTKHKHDRSLRRRWLAALSQMCSIQPLHPLNASVTSFWKDGCTTFVHGCTCQELQETVVRSCRKQEAPPCPPPHLYILL